MKIATFSPITNGALQAEVLPTRIHVLSFGTTKTLDEPIHVNEKTKRTFAATQKRIGRERVPIDFNHNSVEGTKAYENDKEPRAIAGYGSPVIKEDGLWLEDIQWTPTGEKSAKDYEDLSPAPLLDERDNTVIGLHSVALCPAGAISDLHFYAAPTITSMKQRALAAAEPLQPKGKGMKLSADTEKVKEHLDKDIKDEEKEISEDKALKKELTAPNDYKEFQPKSADAVKHGDDCTCPACSRTSQGETEKDEEKREEKLEHPTYCMCDSCSSDLRQKIYTKARLYSGPFGVIQKTMSAVPLPTAYITEPVENKTFRTFMDQKIQTMASELGLPDAAELEKRLKAWLAEWLGEKNVSSPITGDPKPAQFTAEVAELTQRIKVLESDRTEQVARFAAMEKDTIVSEATKNGKVVPFSAEEIKELSPKTLKSIIDKLPATVPMVAKTKVLSASGKPETKVTLSDSAKAIQEQVDAVLANS